MWPFKDSPLMRKPLAHRIVISLFTAAALHIEALAAGAPVVEELQFDPSPSAGSTLASADQLKGSGGISPLAQLAPSGSLNEMLDDSYVLSDSPVFRIKPTDDTKSLTVGYEFETTVSSSTWTNFVYKGANYRWQPKLFVRHSWEVNGNAPTPLKMRAFKELIAVFNWLLKSDKTSLGLLSVSNRGKVEKFVNGKWQPATERLNFIATGTVEKEPYSVEFTWLGRLPASSSSSPSVEKLSYSGKIPCKLRVTVSLFDPNSFKAIFRREFTHSKTWSWKDASIERPMSLDTIFYTLDLFGEPFLP